MATSGTTSYNLNVNELAMAVLDKTGVIMEKQTASAEKLSKAVRAINLLVKSWRTRGVRMWDLTNTVIPMRAGTVYIGTDGLDWEAIIPHTTATANRPIAGNTHLGYYKPLTTAAGASWSSGQSAVSAGVYALATNTQDIVNVRLVKSGTIKWLTSITREQWLQLNTKQETGEPNQYYFEKRGVGESPMIYLFPFPSSFTDYVINLDTVTIAEDMPLGASVSDYLQNFNLAIIYGAAAIVAPEFPAVPKSTISMLRQEAEYYTEQAFKADEEDGDIRFIPRGGH